MAVAYVGVDAETIESRTIPMTAQIAGAVAGDLLVVNALASSGQTVTPEAGWTTLLSTVINGVRNYLFVRLHDGRGAAYTFALSETSRAGLAMTAYRGARLPTSANLATQQVEPNQGNVDVVYAATPGSGGLVQHTIHQLNYATDVLDYIGDTQVATSQKVSTTLYNVGYGSNGAGQSRNNGQGGISYVTMSLRVPEGAGNPIVMMI